MELEQILQHLEWLDDERRKDKTTIAALQERVNSLEGGLSTAQKQVDSLTGDVTRAAQLLSRFDPIEDSIGQLRVELTRTIEGIEKQRAERERELEKVRRADLESVNKSVLDVRKGLDPIADLKKSMQVRIDEESRLNRDIDDLNKRFLDSQRGDEDYHRTIKLLDETIRQDAKRLVDLQGEVTAVRKRLDEYRGRMDLSTDSLRKIELRISEIQAAENDRRQTQASFFDKQALLQVDRDRLWMEWQARFEDVEKTSRSLDTQLQNLELIQRSIKRSQEGFDDVTQRFERRINEITEMQRLTEERFRQEWVGFRADDQKRWTNYTLAQDETGRESGRQYDKVNERLVGLEDISQELQDTMHQMISENKKRLQMMLALSHEMVEEYERTFGTKR